MNFKDSEVEEIVSSVFHKYLCSHLLLLLVLEECRGNCDCVYYATISAFAHVTSGVKWLTHAADFSCPFEGEEMYLYPAMCLHDVALNWHWM
jgi:hypothetical protein